MAAIAGALTHRYNDRPLARVVFTESHDEDGNNGGRLPHDIDPQHPDSFWAKKRSTLGAAIMFSTPGIPMMFRGQEIQLTGAVMRQTAPALPEQFDADRPARFRGELPAMVPVVDKDPLAPSALPTPDSWEWSSETGRTRAPARDWFSRHLTA